MFYFHPIVFVAFIFRSTENKSCFVRLQSPELARSGRRYCASSDTRAGSIDVAVAVSNDCLSRHPLR